MSNFKLIDCEQVNFVTRIIAIIDQTFQDGIRTFSD
jgi:hypothetical protein